MEGSTGRTRVLVLSTAAFTLMFAVWMMFGILGIPIQKELGLSDAELSWIFAVAILNGSMWRLPAGIADRIGGRVVTIGMLAATAVPAYLVSQATSYGILLLLTATFIFPALLLRPVGGWVSDRFGARRACTSPSRPCSS